jgi:TP901 family phage tail tape measure protein
MASLQDEVVIKFRADTAAFGSGLKKAQSSLSRFGTNAFFLGSRITAGIGVPIALLTKAIVGIGAAFDQAMTESLAIMGRDGNQMRTQMEDVAKSIALQTKFSAEEAAQAYFFLASSGLNAAESMKALPVAAQFAQAGVIGLEKATELLSDAYITLGLRSTDPIENMQNMQRVADVLTEANNRAQGSIIEFAQALTNRAGVAFRTFGISVEEGVAALAAFAERGIKGRTAGRQLFIVIRDLQRAFLKNREEWEKLVGPGAVFDETTKEFKNLATIIGTLEDSLEGLTDQTKKTKLQTLGFQERSLQATLALLGASDRVRELQGYLEAAGGATQRVSEKQMTSFTNQLGLVSERLKQVGIDLFDAFRPTIENHVLPMVRAFIQRLKDLSLWIQTLSPEMRAMIVNVIGLTAVLGPAVAAVGALSLVLIPLIGILKTLSGFIAVKAIVSLFAGWKKGTTVVTKAGAAVQGFRAIMSSLPFMVWVKGAAAALASLVVLYKGFKLVTAGTREVDTGLRDLSSQIGISVTRFQELINEYSHLFVIGPLTEDQSNRFAHTQDMLAAATGLTVDQFKSENEVGLQLIGTLQGMVDITKDYGAQKLKDHEETKVQLKEQLDLLTRRRQEIKSGIEAGVGSRISLFAYTGKGADIPRMTAPEFQLSPVTMEKLVAVERELIIEQSTLLTQLGQLDAEMLKLATATDNLTETQIANAKTASDKVQKDLEDISVKKLQALATAAYDKQVQDLIDSLLGLSNDALEKLIDAWERLTKSGYADEAAIKNLWEAYKNLRGDLAPGALPEDIERVTRGLRLQEEALEFAESASGKFISSMAGFDPVAEELLGNQSEIIKQFNDLEGVMDPRFFKEHGKMLEILATHYGDDLEPGLQELIKAYEEWRKTSTSTTDSVVKDQKKASVSISEAADRMTASMMDKQAELNAFTLSAQDAEIVGLKKGYNVMKLNHDQTISDMIAAVKLLPEAEHHAANMRVKQTREASEKMLAAEERIGVLRMLKALDVDDRILRNHEGYSIDWLNIERERLLLAMEEWEKYHSRVAAISSVAGLFSDLSSIAPSLQGVGEALSGVASATGAWGTSAERFKKEGASAFDKVTASVSMATAAVSAFNAISKVGSRGARGAMGALAGAQMGSAFGAVGAAVGAGVGLLAGLISRDPGWVKIQKTIQTKWNVSVTEGLSKEIEKTAKEVGNDWGAALLHINQVIEESGGVTAQNVGKWTRQVRDAFSMIDMGVFTAAEAAEVLDENFALLAEAGTRLSGVLKADVFELIQLDEQFRTNSAAIQEFKDVMVDQAIAGLMMFTEGVTLTRKGFVEAFDEKIAKVTELGDKTEEEINRMRQDFDEKLFQKLKDDFRGLSEMVEMSFSVMVEQGKPFVQILLELGPSLDELIILVDTLGFTGSDTLDMLLRFREFTQVNEQLMKKIDGARMMMVGLTNAGYLSEEAFETFGKTVNNQFDRLITKGLSADEAMLLMIPSLIALQDAAALYGFEISDNTQKILDQAREKGLMGDKAKTVDDHMLAAQHAMVDALGTLITLFGGDLPDSLRELQKSAEQTTSVIAKEFESATDLIQKDLDNLRMPSGNKINIDVNYRTPQGIDFGSNFRSEFDFDSFQHGGVISKPTIAMTGEGGEPELIGSVGFMTKALEGAMELSGQGKQQEDILNEMRGLRKDMRLMPIHLRDAIILAN